MGDKVMVDFTQIINKLKNNLQPLAIGAIRTLKGKNQNEGKFMLVITLDPSRDLKIVVDTKQMFQNKHYFDNLTENIYELVEKSNRSRFEKCRITV